MTTRKTNLFNVLILHTGLLNVVQEGGSSSSSSRLLLCGVTCDGVGGNDILESMSWWEIMMSIRAWCLGADNTTRAVNEISRSLLTAGRGITRVEMGVRLVLLEMGYWLFHSTFSRHMRNRPCVATTQLPFLLELFSAWRWRVLWLSQYSPRSKCPLAHECLRTY